MALNAADPRARRQRRFQRDCNAPTYFRCAVSSLPSKAPLFIPAAIRIAAIVEHGERHATRRAPPATETITDPIPRQGEQASHGRSPHALILGPASLFRPKSRTARQTQPIRGGFRLPRNDRLCTTHRLRIASDTEALPFQNLHFSEREAMTWIIIGSYIAVHFLLYTLIFRHRAFFWSEWGILLFLLVPAAILVILAFASFLWQPSFESLALFVSAFAACGIYTLSFLECWLLSEGGYSLRILSELVRSGTATPAELEMQFIDMSARKKINRLESLLGMGMVKKDSDRFQLTRQGNAVAGVLTLIAAIAGFRAVR